MWLQQVEKAPEDPILGIVGAFNADKSEEKINLGVGAYRDDKGNPFILSSVAKAVKLLAEELGKSYNEEYLPIEGLQSLRDESAKLLFGKDSKALKEKRIAVAQSLSGTGALKVAADFIKHNGKNEEVWVSKPTWENHHKIFANAGLKVKEYRYYSPQTKGLDFEGMLEDLKTASKQSTIVFHACAHNPTGVDLNFEQWKTLSHLVSQNQLFVIFDIAYQGYATGDCDEDAKALRYFESLGLEMMVCQSYAKNFGLYGERVGTVSVVTSSPQIAEAVLSRLKLVIRSNYSSPPKHGALIVSKVLSDDSLRQEWLQELKVMSERVKKMRETLYDLLTNKLKTPGDWSHIKNQIGMFAYTGLTPSQVQELRDKFHIYMVSTGRISVAGLNTSNVERFARSVHSVVSSDKSNL